MPVYKDAKKGTWYAAFYYRDWTGVTKHTCKRGFKTQREAKEYERSFMNQLLHSSDITFANLVENYMEDMGSRLKPTTMDNKKNIIEAKLVPYFGKLKISDIDTITIRRWQNEVINYTDEEGNHYKPTYLKSMNAQLSAIMNYAVRHYGLQKNPCHAAGPIGKQKADTMNFWTQDQYEQFISFEHKPNMRLAFDILFYSGMRCGEMLALTQEDILPDFRIDINKNYQIVDGVEMFLIPKTDKSRRCISIPEFLYDEIMQYISDLWHYKPSDRIFDFTRSAVDKEIHRVADLAGLPHIRVHDLRHSHVSMLINMGIDIKKISERLGHESIKVTMDTYGHLYPDSDKKLADALDQLRRPERKEDAGNDDV